VCGLALSDNTLFGTTRAGGAQGAGTVFRLNTDGSGFTNLHNFAGYPTEGAHPYAGLILESNKLYGTTLEGGSWDFGTVFAVNTGGTGFATPSSLFLGGYSSVHPTGGLLLTGNKLFGTAPEGGSSGHGAVFVVNDDGTNFNEPYSFSPMFPVNSDGAHPHAGLLLWNDMLYGTALDAGSFGSGAVFAIKTDGTGFTELYAFTPLSTYVGFPNLQTNCDGAHPYAGLLLSGSTLYGTASDGGGFGNGVLFKIDFAPQLKIVASRTNIILTWPTNYAGFDYTGYNLESTANFVSPVWSKNAPTPVVINGQKTVTNLMSGTQQFFRLSQ